MADIEIVPVTRDPAYWTKMIPAAQQFWFYLQTDTPPPLTADDFMDEVDPATEAALQSWYQSKKAVLTLEAGAEKHTDQVAEAIRLTLNEEKANLETARALIQACMKHPKVRAAGVKVITRAKGGIDVRLDERAMA